MTTIDLADSIMITEYVNYLDVTFNGGAVVRLCRCMAEKFPESMVIQLGGTPDNIKLGVPRDLAEFFGTMGDDGGGIYLIQASAYDEFLAHIKAGGQQACRLFPPLRRNMLVQSFRAVHSGVPPPAAFLGDDRALPAPAEDVLIRLGDVAGGGLEPPPYFRQRVPCGGLLDQPPVFSLQARVHVCSVTVKLIDDGLHPRHLAKINPPIAGGVVLGRWINLFGFSHAGTSVLIKTP
jgi:hypothetical protein